MSRTTIPVTNVRLCDSADQAQSVRARHGLGARFDLKLQKDVLDVGFYRFRCDSKRASNFFV